MTLVELKRSLLEKIENIDDKFQLERISSFIEIDEEDVFIIPEHMKKGIQQANSDIQNGDVYAMEDFEKRYEKWLKD